MDTKKSFLENPKRHLLCARKCKRHDVVNKRRRTAKINKKLTSQFSEKERKMNKIFIRRVDND